ncbi:MAG: DUF2889 domain-containing protein [Sphingobium sp.]
MTATGDPDAPDVGLSGETLPIAAAAPATPAGPAPLRRAHSVRRTTSLEVRWPDGRTGLPHFTGHARDIATGAAGSTPLILREQRIGIRIVDRMLGELTTEPPFPALQALVGLRIGRDLRARLDDILARQDMADAPVRILIDDLVGLSVIAPFGWAAWDPQPAPAPLAPRDAPPASGVCIGHRPLARPSDARAIGRPATRRAVSVVNPADPDGWHALSHDHAPNVRRARRIDAWLEDDVIHVDSTFQDSARNRARGRTTIHEYKLMATIGAQDLRLLSVEAIPCILPFPECPAATANLFALLGTPLSGLRADVLTILRRTAGCTHLNDAVRALADIPLGDLVQAQGR